MGQLLSIHNLELKPGVSEAEFEAFMRAEVVPLYGSLPGMMGRLLKGDRGKRKHKYALLIELDSPERRDHYFPLKTDRKDDNELDEDRFPEEVKQLLADKGHVFERLDKSVEQFPDTTFTDYVAV
jgi:hypothetical protein